VALSLGFTEVLLRAAFWVFAHTANPNCGARPELLARLIRAYSQHRPRPDASDGMIADPHRGYRHAPNLRNRELHGAATSTNSRGMRGAREYPVPRPPSVIRVAAVGDSFTYGEGLRDEETWPAQLERAIPGTEVMNLGERGYAHDQMYFALRDDGMPLEPDVVIVGFYLNDLWRDELTFYCSEKPRLSPTPTGWVTDNVPVPTPWDSYDRARRMPLLYAVPRVIFEAALQPPLTDRSGEERGAEAIRRMRQLAEGAGARFVMVNLPDHPERPPVTGGFFHEYCARTGAECVDPWPLFRAAAGTADPAAMRARFQGRYGIHYSPEGYAVVVDALRRHFAERPLARRGGAGPG
jgi:hypothetical protein